MEPVIRYDASSGSDTAASGAGPDPAIGGSPNVATVVAGPSSVIELTTGTPLTVVDLSDVATDGSHVIWMDTPSGRKLSKIVGKVLGNSFLGIEAQVTVEDTFSFAGSVTFAIGGKRETLKDRNDFKEGWTIEFESGVYEISNTWTIPVSIFSSVGFNIRAASGAPTKPIIRNTSTTSSTAMLLFSNNTSIRGIRFENNSTNSILSNTASVLSVVFVDCDFIGAANSSTASCMGYYNNNKFGMAGLFDGCYFEKCRYGAYWNGGRCNAPFINCRFFDCYYGIRTSTAGNNGHLQLNNCIFHELSSFPLWIGTQNTWSNHVQNCTFYDNGNDCVYWQGNNNKTLHIVNNIFVNNAGWAIRDAGSAIGYKYENWNVFHNNTSGNVFGTEMNSGGDSVTGDPNMTDPANGDFSIPHDSNAADMDGNGRYAGAKIPDDAPPQSVGYAFG